MTFMLSFFVSVFHINFPVQNFFCFLLGNLEMLYELLKL